MNETHKHFDKAVDIHRKHGLRKISMSALSKESIDDAMEAAEHLYDDMVMNSHLYPEFKDALKLLEDFPPEDKSKAIGIIFNLMEECKTEMCPVRTVVEISEKWLLKSDSFNALVKTLFD